MMNLSAQRPLFYAVLLCALVLPLVAQAQVNSTLAAPALGCHLSAHKCQMHHCTCQCCQRKGAPGALLGCNCVSASLVCLPATGVLGPSYQGSFNYVAVIAPMPKIITADIFRPPQA